MASSMRQTVSFKTHGRAGPCLRIIRRVGRVACRGAKKMRVVPPGHPVRVAGVVVSDPVRAGSGSVRPRQCRAGRTQDQYSDETGDDPRSRQKEFHVSFPSCITPPRVSAHFASLIFIRSTMPTLHPAHERTLTANRVAVRITDTNAAVDVAAYAYRSSMRNRISAMRRTAHSIGRQGAVIFAVRRAAG